MVLITKFNFIITKFNVNIHIKIETVGKNYMLTSWILLILHFIIYANALASFIPNGVKEKLILVY